MLKVLGQPIMSRPSRHNADRWARRSTASSAMPTKPDAEGGATSSDLVVLAMTVKAAGRFKGSQAEKKGTAIAVPWSRGPPRAHAFDESVALAALRRFLASCTHASGMMKNGVSMRPSSMLIQTRPM